MQNMFFFYPRWPASREINKDKWDVFCGTHSSLLYFVVFDIGNYLQYINAHKVWCSVLYLWICFLVLMPVLLILLSFQMKSSWPVHLRYVCQRLKCSFVFRNCNRCKGVSWVDNDRILAKVETNLCVDSTTSIFFI